MLVVAPEPAIAPGLIVQLPVGRPLSATLPVASAQVGCVIAPTTGAVGVVGCALMVTLFEAGDMHPAAFVTVKVYGPAASDVTVYEVPVPATEPGFIVQLPAGSPLRATLPVATVHVGCVTVPATGAVGVDG